MSGDTTEGTSTLRVSPLHAAHVALGAKMVPFGGWEMPVAYPSGTVVEHRTCRADAVAFDVSHLGTVRVTGPDAFEQLQQALSNDLRRVHPGRAQYTHLLDEDGSVVDDLIVWWIDEARFDVMPNASNTSDVLAALGGQDVTGERAVVAIQGPEARARLSGIAPEAAAVHRFCVEEFEWRGAPCFVAGTGYTGEDGVECAVPAAVATEFWEAVLAQGIAPAGLGARDTLRLEAGLPLHGHELGPGITPLQAGLGWVVGWDKPEFTGRTALEEERATGPARRLRGIVADGRQPLRDGSVMQHGSDQVGMLTSGNFSPMRERGIGLGFVDADAQLLDGDAISVRQRGKELSAILVRPPLWPVREEDE
ncbi:MAG TPA: glycine cleavage system aminomethyltransferase GcvT [Acidimicrobiales bacterium]|jgi:aminomethyltransferase|nr:glycine cleavage system aminomethyltransferase GcvT [Acidimicrobiales bacterium]